MPTSWSDTIVFSAGNNWDEVWPSERHLANHVSSLAPVLYVDPPMSVARNPRSLTHSLRSQLTEIRPGLARFTPLGPPGMTRPGIERGTTALLKRQMHWATRQLGASVRAVVACQINNFVFGATEERLKVLYGTDDFVAGAALMGLPETRLRHLEREVITSADLLFAVSPHLIDHWSHFGTRSFLLPNGCEPEAFRRVDEVAPPTDVVLPRPIVGFSGQLSDRIDFGLLEAIAATGVSLLMVGGRQKTAHAERFEHLLTRPNVQWMGARPFDEVPSYLSIMDVAITPYEQTDFNRASFPLKTMEYLAAGLPTVATDLPAARMLEDVVRIASTEAEFVAAVQQTLLEPRDPQQIEARRKVAETGSWRSRAQQFMSNMEESDHR